EKTTNCFHVFARCRVCRLVRICHDQPWAPSQGVSGCVGEKSWKSRKSRMSWKSWKSWRSWKSWAYYAFREGLGKHACSSCVFCERVEIGGEWKRLKAKTSPS
ncbi:unnamed protein product, partial [Hapterophycus canaliculatus]